MPPILLIEGKSSLENCLCCWLSLHAHALLTCSPGHARAGDCSAESGPSGKEHHFPRRTSVLPSLNDLECLLPPSTPLVPRKLRNKFITVTARGSAPASACFILLPLYPSLLFVCIFVTLLFRSFIFLS